MTNEIKKLQSIVENAPLQFQKRLPMAERFLLSAILLHLKDLKTDSSGRIISSIENLNIVNKINSKLEKLVLTKDYLRELRKFVQSYANATYAANAYYKSINDEFKMSPYYTAIRDTAIKNITESLTAKGLNAAVMKPIQ